VFWTAAGYPPDETINDGARLGAIEVKQGALLNLFKTDGKWFEVQTPDGSVPPLRFQPRIKSIDFPEGKWYDYCDFTINMEADIIYFGNQIINGLDGCKPQESWNIEPTDDKLRAYKLTHTISSQQKNIFDATGAVVDGNYGWQRAKSLVLPRLGYDASFGQAPSVLNLTGWQPYNYTRSSQIDESAGRYTVTETWLVLNTANGTIPPCFDDFSVTNRLTEEGLTRVNIEGTITGFETRDPSAGTLTQTRFAAANDYFNTYVINNVYNRAKLYAGIDLNTVALSATIARNPNNGTITYSAEYDNRATPAIAGAINESITVSDRGGEDVFAQITVLGRPVGPVLQSIFTYTAKSRSISIEAIMPAASLSYSPSKPNTDSLVLALAPAGFQVFREKDEVSWLPRKGRYTRQVNFVYQ
jgi:hypothetical protein